MTSSSPSSPSFSSFETDVFPTAAALEEVFVRVFQKRRVDKTLREVAGTYGVNYHTLRNHFYNDPRHKLLDRGNRVLSSCQEEQLVALINAFCDNRTPLTLKSLVRWVVRLFQVPPPNKDWPANFFNRHKSVLKLTHEKFIAQKRVSASSLVDVEGFIALMEHKWTRLPQCAFQIANYDESSVMLKGIECEAISSKHRTVKGRIGPSCRFIGSILPFVSADGNVIMMVYVFPQKSIDESKAKSLTVTIDTVHEIEEGEWPTYYAFSKTGYVNTGLFLNVIKQLITVRASKGRTEPLFLFGDNLAAHRNPTTVATALKANIHMVFFPPNCSHFIQPLDGYPFARFKQVLRRLQEDIFLGSYLNNSLQGVGDLKLSEDALRTSFTPETIRAAFRDTGLFPFNKQLILQRALTNVGIVGPTPNIVLQDFKEAIREELQSQKEVHAKGLERVLKGKQMVQGSVLYQLTASQPEDNAPKENDPAPKKPRVGRKRTLAQMNSTNTPNDGPVDEQTGGESAPKQKRRRTTKEKI